MGQTHVLGNGQTYLPSLDPSSTELSLPFPLPEPRAWALLTQNPGRGRPDRHGPPGAPRLQERGLRGKGWAHSETPSGQ